MDTSLINILAIGYNASIMEVMDRLLNKHGGWKGTIALSKENAVARLTSEKYDAVLLCAGVSSEEEAAFKQIIEKPGGNTVMIRHFGGGSGLLESEIRTALNK